MLFCYCLLTTNRQPYSGTKRNGESQQQQPQTSSASLAFSLQGGTGADCVLCAFDQKQGLLQHIGLAPALTVVGIQRGPAVGSGESHVKYNIMCCMLKQLCYTQQLQ